MVTCVRCRYVVKLLVGAVDATYVFRNLLIRFICNIPCRYDCKDNSDDPTPAPVKGGNAPRLMQGTVGPLSRGGSAQVHDFSDESDEEEGPSTAEEQLRRRLGQLGN